MGVGLVNYVFTFCFVRAPLGTNTVKSCLGPRTPSAQQAGRSLWGPAPPGSMCDESPQHLSGDTWRGRFPPTHCAEGVHWHFSVEMAYKSQRNLRMFREIQAQNRKIKTIWTKQTKKTPLRYLFTFWGQKGGWCKEGKTQESGYVRPALPLAGLRGSWVSSLWLRFLSVDPRIMKASTLWSASPGPPCYRWLEDIKEEGGLWFLSRSACSSPTWDGST